MNFYSIPTCRGVLTFDKVESIIPRISIETLDGMPDKPENLTVEKSEPKKAEISWKTPTISRGIIQEYKIDVFPKFDKNKMDDKGDVCGKEVRHEQEFGLVAKADNVTRVWIENLSPATTYDVTVRAKTRHSHHGHPSDALTVSTPSGRPHKPTIEKAYQSRGGHLIIDFSYLCPTTGKTTFRASWDCAMATTEGLSCGQKVNVSQTFLTPTTIQLSGLQGGHYYDLKVTATVEDCFEGDCQSESDSYLAFLTCDYRCRDGSCLHNPNAR